MEDLLATVSAEHLDTEQTSRDTSAAAAARFTRSIAPRNPFDDDDGPTELEEVVIDTNTGHTNSHTESSHKSTTSLEAFYEDVGRINSALADVRRSLNKLSSQFEASTTSTRYAKLFQSFQVLIILDVV